MYISRNFCILLVVAACMHAAVGFRPGNMLKSAAKMHQSKLTMSSATEDDVFDPMGNMVIREKDQRTIDPFALMPALSLMAMQPQAASAAASDYGIFAGRTASLLHPVTNFALFFTSVYAAYLGFQWRRLRDIGDEIKELNKGMPMLSTGQARSPIAETIKAINNEISALSAKDDTDSSSKVSALQSDLKKLQSATALDAQIMELTATRKSLVSMNLRDKHHLAGSYLLGAGVTVSVLGAFNTYMRAGKLFPGPHLYAGMGIVICWAGEITAFFNWTHSAPLLILSLLILYCKYQCVFFKSHFSCSCAGSSHAKRQ